MKKIKLAKGKITGLVIGLVMTLTLFFVLTFIQHRMLMDTEKTVAVLAKKLIPAGTVITDENASDFLKEVEISSVLATPETYQSVSSLFGKYVMRNTEANEIMYSGLLGDDAETLSKYENPIELSLNIEENASAVAGSIRKGDYVNVYAGMKNQEGNSVYDLVLERVLINEVYDANTVKIAMSDTESVALTFTFYMETEDVPELLNKLETKDKFIVKVK